MRDRTTSQQSQGPIEIPEHVAHMSHAGATGPLIEDLQLLLGVISEWQETDAQLLNALGGVLEDDATDSGYAARGIYTALKVHLGELQEILRWSEQIERDDDLIAATGPIVEELSEIVIHLHDE